MIAGRVREEYKSPCWRRDKKRLRTKSRSFCSPAAVSQLILVTVNPTQPLDISRWKVNKLNAIMSSASINFVLIRKDAPCSRESSFLIDTMRVS